MGYTTQSGRLAFNRLVTPTSDGSNSSAAANLDIELTAQAEIITGDFIILFIANDYIDPDLEAILNDDSKVAALSDLQELTVSQSALLWDGEIPMFARYENVRVLGDNSLNVDGTPITGYWSVEIKRLAVRLDLTLTLTYAQVRMWENAAGSSSPAAYLLHVDNIPGEQYLFPETDNSGVAHTSRAYEAKWESSGYPNYPGQIEQDNSDNSYTITFPRILLPESWFTDKNNESNAVEIRIGLSESGTDKTVSGRIGYDLTLPDYTLPRNTYLTVTATVVETEEKEELCMHLSVNDWDDGDVDDMTGNRELKVSAVKAEIDQPDEAVRIWFWTDQPEVSIHTMTVEGKNTDDVFYDLTGNSLGNFYFDNSTGEGWFDIITDLSKPEVTAGVSGQHGLILDAGELKRTITVTVNIP
ncbi:MAG: hypothetical protein LUD15_14015 [Bacteroides sp.]|nr:hypothetical protein [Bacteroides sp.]